MAGEPRAARSTADESEVRAAHAAWIGAVDAGDLDRLLELMSDDAVFLSPGQALVGRDGFAAGFTAAHERARIDCTSELLDVVVAGDVAYTLCRDALAVTPRAGGAVVALAGHRMSVYRRAADGRWRLARDAHRLVPVAR
ncbi:MAG: SgcJ/EcaC family oxidoreductase [Pelomonas sp.]|nr:SgcJ/EcaC family oxidoreductase [Roseateles sp.]